MSQVKNLRAMFEQRGESSPPDRGRTPGQSPTGSKASESPRRPLSLVRTNFIAIVEKDGRIGLQRDPSTDSAVSQLRKTAGGSEDVVSTPIQQENPPSWRTPPSQTVPASVSEQSKSRASTPPSNKATTPEAASRPIPNSPHSIMPAVLRELKAVKQGLVAAAAAAEKPVDNGPKKVLGKALEIKPSTSTPAKAKTAASTTANGATNNDAKHTSSAASKSTAQPTAGHTAPVTPKTANGHGNKETHKPTAAAATGKHVPKTIATKTTAKPAKRSPTLSKTPSPTKHTAPKLHSKTPEKKAPAVAEKAATPKTTASTAGKSTAPSSAKKPSAIHAIPSNGGGFVKPKPKSPTRPVHLPAGLTSHTAASATKANVTRQSLSSMSGNFNLVHAAAVARSPSRMSVSTIATTTVTPKGLRRQNSAANRPRPSIGPPPKQPAQDHPILRKEKEVDEGFLARMMRPTQASASKTIDKALTPQVRKQTPSPTKRTVARKSPILTKKSVDAQKEMAASTKAPVTAAIAADTAKSTPQITPVEPTPTEEVEPTPTEEVSPVNVEEEVPAAATQQAETDGSAPADSSVEAADSVTSEQAPTEGTEADSTAVETVDVELESTETKVSSDDAPEEDVKSAQVVEAPVPENEEGMVSVTMV